MAQSIKQLIKEMSPGERWCAIVGGTDGTPEVVIGWFDSHAAAHHYVTELAEMSDTQEVQFCVRKGYQAQTWQP